MDALFDRAFLVATMDGREPLGADMLSIIVEQPEKQTTRALERLVAEGVCVRTDHETYCRECGSDSGVEYRYALAALKDPKP